MTTQIESTLQAALEMLVKHGIRRTSMADIADAAGVSRQTLYSQFENKEGIIKAVISYTMDQMMKRTELEWQSCSSLSEKLDAYFERVVLEKYRMMQSMPDAADVLTTVNAIAAAPIQQAISEKTKKLQTVLEPRHDNLKKHGESPESVAGFIVAICDGIITDAATEDGLKKKLNTLKKMVLLVAEK